MFFGLTREEANAQMDVSNILYLYNGFTRRNIQVMPSTKHAPESQFYLYQLTHMTWEGSNMLKPLKSWFAQVPLSLGAKWNEGTHDCCDCFEEFSTNYHLAMKHTNGNNLGLGKVIQHDFHCRFSLERKSLRAVEAHIAHIAGNVLTIFGKHESVGQFSCFSPITSGSLFDAFQRVSNSWSCWWINIPDIPMILLFYRLKPSTSPICDFGPFSLWLAELHIATASL